MQAFGNEQVIRAVSFLSDLDGLLVKRFGSAVVAKSMERQRKPMKTWNDFHGIWPVCLCDDFKRLVGGREGRRIPAGSEEFVNLRVQGIETLGIRCALPSCRQGNEQRDRERENRMPADAQCTAQIRSRRSRRFGF